MEGQIPRFFIASERGGSVKAVRGWGAVANRGHSPVGGEHASELDRGGGWLHNTGKCAKSQPVAHVKAATLSVPRT